MQNPILTLIKTAAFVVLAVLVGLSFWQRLKEEDRTEMLGKRISDVEVSIGRLTTTIGKLDRRIQKGGAAISTAGSGGPLAVGEPPLPGQVDNYAYEAKPAPWLTGRAKELWGTYGANYLKPDPDEPHYPSLDDPKLDADGGITAWYGSAPPDLNPLTLSDGRVTIYVSTYCSELWANVHSQNPYLYAPALAYRVEASPDYKTWIFWVRPGVRWHTPQADLSKYPHLKGDHFLTAEDWKFTMDLIMNPDVRTAHIRSYFADFDRCEVVDDHCFIMHWKKSSFSSIASNLNMTAPVPKFIFGYDDNGNAFDPATIGSQFNDHWFAKAFKKVGTGPYQLAEYDPESHMTIHRFDDYWGELPPIKTVKREMFPDRSLHYTKFEAGEFAYAEYLTPAWQKRVASDVKHSNGEWGEHWIWSTSYMFIAYKNTHPFFRDVRVRTAMTHACDRVRLLQATNQGKGKIVTGPQSMHAPTYPDDIVPIPYDLEKARALLQEAGWADKDGNGVLEREIDGTVREFRVTAMSPTAATYETLFKIFGEDLAKIGIRLKIEPLQWSQFTKGLDDRTFDITALMWSTSGWDNDMSQIWHSKMVEESESSNFIEFADPEVDRLIEKARQTFDLDERVKVQSAAHRRIHELQPYTFLFTFQTPVVWWTKKLSDYKEAQRWRDRPYARTLPLYVPSK